MDSGNNSLYQSVKVVKNAQNISLPSKPKILMKKKNEKQRIAQLLIKSSPLKKQSQKMSKSKSKGLIEDQIRSVMLQLNKIDKGQQDFQKISNVRQSAVKNNQKNNKSLQDRKKIKAISKDSQQSHQQKDKMQNYGDQSREFNHQSYTQQSQSHNTSDLFYDGMSKSLSSSQLDRHSGSIKSYGPNNTKLDLNRQKSKSKLIRKQTITQPSNKIQSKLNISSTNPQFMAKNRFYHYCAQQIIKLSNQTSQMKEQMKKRQQQTKRISLMNKQLEFKIQRQKNNMEKYLSRRNQLQKQRQPLKLQLQEYQTKVYQQLPELYKEKYKQQYNDQKSEIQQKMNQIKMQQIHIQELRKELNQHKIEQEEHDKLEEENKRIKSEIDITKKKRIEYDARIMRKNHVIKHLQEIKNVEYQNLIDCLNDQNA